MLRTPVLSIAIVLLSSAPVLAQSDTEEQARVHYESGRLHYESGEYEQALGEFEAAYRLSSRPALLYNLYLAHQNLGHLTEAADSLERYLAEGEIEQADRPQLEARLANLRRRIEAGEGQPTGGGDTPVGPEAPEAGHAHTGLMLRLGLGFGYVHASTPLGALGKLTLSGGSSAASISAGWAFFENLVFQIELWQASMVGGTVRVTGLPGAMATPDARYDAGGLGLGATYYFMPINIYVSGSLGGATTSVSVSGVQAQSRVGVGLALMAGKEWWIGEDWGLGVALQFVYFATKWQDEMTREVSTISGTIASVLASLTYN